MQSNKSTILKPSYLGAVFVLLTLFLTSAQAGNRSTAYKQYQLKKYYKQTIYKRKNNRQVRYSNNRYHKRQGYNRANYRSNRSRQYRRYNARGRYKNKRYYTRQGYTRTNYRNSSSRVYRRYNTRNYYRTNTSKSRYRSRYNNRNSNNEHRNNTRHRQIARTYRYAKQTRRAYRDSKYLYAQKRYFAKHGFKHKRRALRKIYKSGKKARRLTRFGVDVAGKITGAGHIPDGLDAAEWTYHTLKDPSKAPERTQQLLNQAAAKANRVVNTVSRPQQMLNNTGKLINSAGKSVNSIFYKRKRVRVRRY